MRLNLGEKLTLAGYTIFFAFFVWITAVDPGPADSGDLGWAVGNFAFLLIISVTGCVLFGGALIVRMLSARSSEQLSVARGIYAWFAAIGFIFCAIQVGGFILDGTAA